jgi:hypothetical protein
MDHVWQEPPTEPGNRNPMNAGAARTKLARARRRRLSAIGVLGLAVAAAAVVVIVLLVTELGGKHISVPPPNSGPALVSQGQLERLAGSLSQPVYWAGPKSGYSYELTRTASGRIFIRYLPKGVQAGDPRPSFLVVATYSQVGSFFDLQRAGKQKDSVSVPLDKGGLVVFNTAKPTSVYFGYPSSNYQVEVYDPSGNTARSLVLAGKVKPIR